MFVIDTYRSNHLVLADADAKLADASFSLMMLANASEAHAPTSSTYGHAHRALVEALTVGLRGCSDAAGEDAGEVYAVMLDSHITAPEAVAVINGWRKSRRKQEAADYAELLRLAAGDPARIPDVEAALTF